MLTHLLYHSAGAKSAKRLAAFMGILAGLTFDDNEERPDWLIRWGTPKPVPLAPTEGVLNSQAPLSRQSNRIEHLRLLKAGGVKMPHFWTGPWGEAVHPAFPILGRDLSQTDAQTSNGQSITRYLPDQPIGNHAFYTEFIPKIAEFRVDCVAHKTRVRQLTPPDASAVAWNTGGSYDHPHIPVPTSLEPMALAAVKSLHLDFGAVDTILDASGNVYILEVNTAPQLSKPTLEWYAKQFGWILGMDFESMPGWAAVED